MYGRVFNMNTGGLKVTLAVPEKHIINFFGPFKSWLHTVFINLNLVTCNNIFQRSVDVHRRRRLRDQRCEERRYEVPGHQDGSRSGLLYQSRLSVLCRLRITLTFTCRRLVLRVRVFWRWILKNIKLKILL